MTKAGEIDILSAVALQLRCDNCGGFYSVTLRQLLLSQDALHEGCHAPSAAECYPVAFASLVERDLIEQFQDAWLHLQDAARKAGGVMEIRAAAHRDFSGGRKENLKCLPIATR